MRPRLSRSISARCEPLALAILALGCARDATDIEPRRSETPVHETNETAPADPPRPIAEVPTPAREPIAPPQIAQPIAPPEPPGPLDPSGYFGGLWGVAECPHERTGACRMRPGYVGLTGAQVLARFGEPERREGASWFYVRPGCEHSEELRLWISRDRVTRARAHHSYHPLHDCIE
jgi:hypothetical protein